MGKRGILIYYIYIIYNIYNILNIYIYIYILYGCAVTSLEIMEIWLWF